MTRTDGLVCVGLMSGTSLDGVDAALVHTDGEAILGFGPGLERAYTLAERAVLEEAVEAALAWRWDGPEPAVFARAEAILTHTHAEAVEAVCEAAGLAPGAVDLVGFHGQTVVHQPPAEGRPGRTRQIGDGVALAERLGVDVAFDFRSADMEAGGQGAPLVPVYHAALARWSGLETPLAILNIGGVANVTLIGAAGALSAFDTGPGNGLMDAFIQRRRGEAFDENGALAAQGRVHEQALSEMLAHPHFKAAGPKSLDRWDFTLDAAANLSDADGAATLAAFTARTAAAGAVSGAAAPHRIIACGGGRLNAALLAMIESAAGLPVAPAEAVGWRGGLIEAEAFAYLAARTATGRPITFPGTTGVDAPLTGGRIARARRRAA